MSKRLMSDAIIVLERAGYRVQVKRKYLNINDENRSLISVLWLDGATVENDQVIELLERRNRDEFGHTYV